MANKAKARPSRAIPCPTPYVLMTADELADATREFDRPVSAARTRPLTRVERQRWERARGAGGRGARRVVVVPLDDELFRRAGDYAKRRKLSLADLVARSLKSTLSFVE